MSGMRLSLPRPARAGATRLAVSMLGSMPPAKGVSAYTQQLVAALASDDDVDLEFTGFSSIYPRFAYPGGDPNEAAVVTPEFEGVRQRARIAWYNPFSWLRAGLDMQGDVVHAQWWSYALAPVYGTVLGVARLRGKRVVITAHNVVPHEGGVAKRLLNRAIFAFGHAFIVHSEQNRADLQRIIAGDPARITVLPHGVLDTPRTGISRAAARLRLGVPGNAKALLYFGHIRPYKGVDVLLRAFANVLREQPDAMLIVAGKPWIDWAPYDALIDELGIRASLRLHLDFVPTTDVESYFVAADAVVLPYTHFDAQTGVGTRALPFGLPLIVTRTGGLPELVVDPDSVVPPADVVALARAIGRVLGEAELRASLSADSLAIAGTLGWERIAAQTIVVYEAVCGRAQDAHDDGQPVAQAAGVRSI